MTRRLFGFVMQVSARLAPGLIMYFAAAGLITSTASARGLPQDIRLGSSVIHSRILQGIMAKELCTCIHVAQLGSGFDHPLTESQVAKLCLDRAALPLSEAILKTLVNTKLSPDGKVQVTSTLVGDLLGLTVGAHALARYEGPELGCRLLTDDELQPR